MSTQDLGNAYLQNVQGKIEAVEQSQVANFTRAGAMIADAYQQDRLV